MFKIDIFEICHFRRISLRDFASIPILVHESRALNEKTHPVGQQLAPFVSATSEHVRRKAQWQEQLKSERERVRRSLITANYGKEDDALYLW